MRDTFTRRAVLPAAAGMLSIPAGELAAAPSPPLRPFLVTGASSGIGKAAAQLLSVDSRPVLCAARTAAAAQDVTVAQGGIALGVGLEQAALASVRSYIEQLQQDLPMGVDGCARVLRHCHCAARRRASRRLLL